MNTHRIFQCWFIITIFTMSRHIHVKILNSNTHSCTLMGQCKNTLILNAIQTLMIGGPYIIAIITLVETFLSYYIFIC